MTPELTSMAFTRSVTHACDSITLEVIALMTVSWLKAKSFDPFDCFVISSSTSGPTVSSMQLLNVFTNAYLEKERQSKH